MSVEVVYGPPGTGKTSHLLADMAEVKSQGVPPSKIGFLAFTRAAAREALTRLNIKSSSTIRTLHSLAYEVTGCSREQVIDHLKLREFGELVGYALTGTKNVDGEQTMGDEMMELHILAEAMMLPVEEVWHIKRPDLDPDVCTMFSKSYTQWKNAYGYMDFNDMLKGMVSKAPNLGLHKLYVDEGQDLSPLQWAVINGLMKNTPHTVIAGDDDQSIYVWAGADPHGMSKVGGTSQVLSQSHRVPSLAHALAQRVIQRVGRRVPKEYAPRREEGTIERVPGMVYLDTPSRDTLVLYRNHTSRADVEEWLVDKRIPYTMIGSGPSSLFDNRYANAVRGFLSMQRGAEISMATYSCMEKAARYEYKQDFKIKEVVPLLKLPWEQVFDIPFGWADYFREVDLFSKPMVRVSTIHSAKGMEADDVILLNGMGMRTFEEMNDDEHRVWYVGVTRTRDTLTIVEGDNPYDLNPEQ